jgi:hypothetical protein
MPPARRSCPLLLTSTQVKREIVRYHLPNQMKRKRSWREKLDLDGLNSLEGFKKAAEAFKTSKDSSQWRAKLLKIADQHPQIRVLGIVDVLPEFLTLLLSNEELAKLIAQFESTPGKKVLPGPVARLVEIAQSVTLALEDPQMRIVAGFASAFAAVIVGNIYEDISKSHYGDAGPKNSKDWLWTIGTTIESVGHAIKTGKGPKLKGKINRELAEMIKMIRSHQKERLTYRELRLALEHAGVSAPDEETLRGFEWRARKKGWIGE